MFLAMIKLAQNFSHPVALTRQASELGGGGGGGGAFEEQTHICRGGQDIIFKKVLLFAHAVVTGLLSPPGDSPPLKRGRYS